MFRNQSGPIDYSFIRDDSPEQRNFMEITSSLRNLALSVPLVFFFFVTISVTLTHIYIHYDSILPEETHDKPAAVTRNHLLFSSLHSLGGRKRSSFFLVPSQWRRPKLTACSNNLSLRDKKLPFTGPPSGNDSYYSRISVSLPPSVSSYYSFKIKLFEKRLVLRSSTAKPTIVFLERKADPEIERSVFKLRERL